MSDSNDSPLDAVAAAQRAQVLVHTRYPDPGPAFPLVMGLGVAGWVSAYALPIWGRLPVWGALLVGLALYLRHYIDRRGVVPSMSTAPSPIKSAFTTFLAVYALVLVLTAAGYLLVGWWAGAAVGGIGVALVAWDYERRYAIAARQAEAEAGIEPAADSGAGE